MNHLAHLALADGSPASLLGCFLGDFVKGRPEGRYLAAVVRGIRLHRRLDRYTDAHPAVIRTVGRFPRARRRFAWIAVDMAFDHFLARAWQQTAPADFAAFRHHAYGVLRARRSLMPARAQQVTDALTDQDWLGAYANWPATAAALQAMARRLSRPNALAATAADIEAVYTDIEADFRAFWTEAGAEAIRQNRRLARSHPDR